MRWIALVALFAMSVPGVAKDKVRDWKTGTLVDVDIAHGSRVVGHIQNGDGDVHTVRNDATYYKIDAGSLIYIAKRTLTSKYDKQLRLTVNGPIRYALDGDSIYVMDEMGKEHKLSLEEKIAKRD